MTWGSKGFVLAHNSGLQFVPTEKSQHRELQAVGHITSTANGRGEWFPCSTHLLHTLTQFRASCLGNSAAHSGLSPPTSINLIKANCQRLAHRSTRYRQFFTLPSLVFRGCVELTNQPFQPPYYGQIISRKVFSLN